MLSNQTYQEKQAAIHQYARGEATGQPGLVLVAQGRPLNVPGGSHTSRQQYITASNEATDALRWCDLRRVQYDSVSDAIAAHKAATDVTVEMGE